MDDDEDEGGIVVINIIQLKRVAKKLELAQNAAHQVLTWSKQAYSQEPISILKFEPPPTKEVQICQYLKRAKSNPNRI